MDHNQICKIFDDTAYVRMGGSEEELRCAEYLVNACAELGAQARIEDFSVPMAYIHEAKLFVDGEEVTCKGYFCAGNADLEGVQELLVRNMEAAMKMKVKLAAELNTGYSWYDLK